MTKEYVYIGKIVNTHGIKGELRILSNFEKKDIVFKNGFSIFIGEDKIKEEITSYRHHKEFDMITLKSYNNINEVLKYKGKKVYVLRNSLELPNDDYLREDLIDLNVYEKEELLGKVENIVYNNLNILLYIKSTINFYIPLNKEYIKKVDLKNNKIEVENAKGLIL
jgi:16S rRNA processing protein RimM